MEEFSIIYELIIICAISIIIVLLFNKIKVPPLIGFILTGILIGPNGFGLIRLQDKVDLFSEIGIILILFSIGIDFSVSKLINLKKVIFLSGSVQVTLTILLIIPIALLLDYQLNQSVFIGFLVATSSTAIIIKLLITNGEMDTPQGRISLGILIFQDLAVVPMILITPILAGNSGNILWSLIFLLIKLVGILLFIYISIKFIMPNLIFAVAKTKIKELFLFFIILICLVTILLAEMTGISLALGAFIAGLIISETDYNHEALGFVEPLRDVFGSIFFISVGMLFNPMVLLNNVVFIILITLLILILKFFAIFSSVKILKYPIRIVVIVAMILSQFGEFSFVLSKIGLNNNLIDINSFNLLIAIAVLTMILSPVFYSLTPFVSFLLSKHSKSKSELDELDGTDIKLESHIVIIGYGINGRNLSLAAKFANLQYVISEMNPITVKNEKLKGEPIYFGDASKEAVLHSLSIKTAKVCVIAISDPAATRAITSIAKKINPNIYLIARTRFLQEVEPLLNLGADFVIPEEFEKSIQIFSKVLLKFLIPVSDINQFINQIRSSGYSLFRNLNTSNRFYDLGDMVDDYDILSIRIDENKELTGKSLAEIDFRNKYDLTLLAIERTDSFIPNPKSDELILAKDVIIVWGSKNSIEQFNLMF